MVSIQEENKMESKIDYSEFNLTRIGNLRSGDSFLWAGTLYFKTDPCWVKEKSNKGCIEPEWIYKNALQPTTGKHFYFFDEEAVVPVETGIKVDPIVR
jgi:hypothetical protein